MKKVGFVDDILVLLFLVPLLFHPAFALQNLFPKLNLSPTFGARTTQQQKARQVEDALLEAIRNQGSRLANSEQISDLVTKLESMATSQSIPEPAIATEIYGRWRLLYTNNADTSSPIQRKAVDTQAFPIYQDIIFNDKGQLLVNQIVKFSESSELCVSALASTTAYPLEELTERKGEGTILGMNLLGISLVGEQALPDPSRPNSRISFVFDEGNFDFGSIKVPYPVPFRLPILRDFVKGWIDVTWLSDRLRISKGNKGTTFVLLKEG
jgi:hypothetical protein